MSKANDVSRKDATYILYLISQEERGGFVKRIVRLRW